MHAETARRLGDVEAGGGDSGLACVQRLHAHDAEMVIVVLTGYASIATAVEAIKLGARHYLAKPANTDDIEARNRAGRGAEVLIRLPLAALSLAEEEERGGG